MPKLTAKEQYQLDLMRATGFPIKAEDGVYEWDMADMGFPPRMGCAPEHNTKVITDDFSKAVAIFEFWQKHSRNFHG